MFWSYSFLVITLIALFRDGCKRIQRQDAEIDAAMTHSETNGETL